MIKSKSKATGFLIENDGYLQAVNLEFVTRIREWPRKKTARKKKSYWINDCDDSG